jgi:hypothetical protein
MKTFGSFSVRGDGGSAFITGEFSGIEETALISPGGGSAGIDPHTTMKAVNV